MKQIIELNLTSLIKDGITDTISGKSIGQLYAKDVELLKKIEDGYVFKVIIPSDKIKAINDSFLKGFFTSVFEKYRFKNEVETFFKFQTNQHFLNLIDKNLSILHAIYN